jgi:hypothetical protein
MTTSRLQVNREDLPEEIQSLFETDDDLTVEVLFDPEMAPIGIDDETYEEGKMKSAKKLVAHRKFTQEMMLLYKKYEGGQLSASEAEILMNNARIRYMEGS